jgi:hypothetical protein
MTAAVPEGFQAKGPENGYKKGLLWSPFKVLIIKPVL